ncbi:MAG: biopolymer transporter ExbD [Bacteroidia bacterium]|nr:biopolymer transporter ExbD [Bacteroidia bacterium]NNF32331.1 biopolymer transporter ExbD [Flavobacteriaceae bacterium]MBT8276314.1 biopolymer transporter ExbD [Bacteroidia bacterium]NNJ81523.1 biopolymer transporter ExbD [Flavobacteriaceae bacterium]NNK53207.1 biopolymer transporter ExbD [Flavobacteriaceae bacterium]
MNLRGRNKISPEFSMSSMTDIVFLLLVFFLLTSPAITPDALDLILPKAKGKSTNQQKASVSITKDGAYYVNKERVSEYSIEKELQGILAGQDEPTIILRAEEGVPIEDAVFVMDVANKNSYKVVLAVRPN